MLIYSGLFGRPITIIYFSNNLYLCTDELSMFCAVTHHSTRSFGKIESINLNPYDSILFLI